VRATLMSIGFINRDLDFPALMIGDRQRVRGIRHLIQQRCDQAMLLTMSRAPRVVNRIHDHTHQELLALLPTLILRGPQIGQIRPIRQAADGRQPNIRGTRPRN